MADPVRLITCRGCGALVPDIDGPTHAYLGASPGCWAAWGAFQARSFASPAIAAVQPLAVDVYAVQHPGLAERRAIQSVCPRANSRARSSAFFDDATTLTSPLVG